MPIGSVIDAAPGVPKPSASALGLLAKDRTIAGPGFNRWLVPPAALAIHLCIGMAYGFSVFWLPLSKILDGVQACTTNMSVWQELFASCNWRVSSLNLTFTLFIGVLGLAAALWGGWAERAGPRKAGFVAAICWCGGLALGALGIHLHQLWLIWLGPGIIGGIGLGLGYISPVSTLIKWFPDRRGMATGMAIMGFGGGAMIGAPLATQLMKHYAPGGGGGIAATFLTLAIVYFIFMLGGAFGYRIPAAGWKPAGWQGGDQAVKPLVTNRHVHLDTAWKTPQFWLIWVVLCMNVSAGIGVLSMASPMLQEVFGGRLIHINAGINELTADQKVQIAGVAAAFTGLLSLFNIGGRFFWAALSDRIGRKATYSCFFLLGIALYASTPSLGHTGSVALFVITFCIILSMYGGGFATVPAYLSDMFGTQMVGAIHGRLLTAWSVAGVIGPVLIGSLRDYQLSHGIAKAQAYDKTLYILCGLLLIGLICNLLIRAVAERHYMSDEHLAAQGHGSSHKMHVSLSGMQHAVAKIGVGTVLAWAAVGIPVAWGIWTTLRKTALLFS